MILTLADRVEQFETALAADPTADLARFLPPAGDPDYTAVLAELVRVDLEGSWSRGTGRRVADYLRRFPTALNTGGEVLAAVAFEEYRQRRLSGDQADPAEYRAAYAVDTTDWDGLSADSGVWGGHTSVVSSTPPPGGSTPPNSDLFASIRGVPSLGTDDLDARSVADWVKTTTAMPEPGTEFLGFQLDEELGRGAFGRVFLARQADLSGRPVAVKVAYDLAGESRTLAQLQHTNIVPIHSVHRAGKLQAVCMPFFGRTTLHRVIERVGGRPGLPSSGRELLSTIDMRADATVASVSADRKPLPASPPITDAHADGWAKLDGLSYVEAVLWLGVQLADGLAHAHARGILHRDLKPANVLLTDDGRPMLLDFNLAEDTKLRGSAEGAALGGTLPYMSPEQMRAFSQTGGPLDGRTDVYSLGVVLFELLAGRHPFPDRGRPGDRQVAPLLEDRLAGPPSLRKLNADVSPAVEAIIRKCLAPDPADRYQQAAHLRDDLQRQLDHQPLAHATEPSARERARKWGRRHPKLSSATAVGTAAIALLGMVAGGAVAARERSRDSHAHLTLADHRAALRDVRLAAGKADRSRPHLDGLRTDLRALLVRYDVPADGGSDGWLDAPSVRYLPTAERKQLREDVGESFYLLARAAALASRSAPDASDQLAHAERWRTAAERYAAERLPRALKQLRADLAVLRNEADAKALQTTADATAPGSARDRYLLAARLAERGQHKDALAELLPATQLDPHDLSAWFLRGAMHLEVGQPELAAVCFGACTALKADHAPAWLNRGIAYTRTRLFELALADFEKAVALDPNRSRAYLERAIAHEQQGKLAAATADFDRAAADADAPPLTFFRRADLRRRQGDHAGAALDTAEGLRRECRDPANWVARSEVRLAQADAIAALAPAAGLAVPANALSDVRQALTLDPDYPDALQQSAHILSEHLHREADSRAALDRLVTARPHSAEAFAGRGILRARAGEREAAIRDAREALLWDVTAPNKYQVAGIFAHSAAAHADDKREALSLLWSALKTGYGLDLVDGDPDLDPLRTDPEFKRVVQKAKAIQAELQR